MMLFVEIINQVQARNGLGSTMKEERTGIVKIKPVYVSLHDLGSITALQGRILETEDGIHCREIVRMAADFSSKAIRSEMVGSQHVSMIIGHLGEALEEAANLLSMELKMI